jgi:hypothetical protein
VQRVGLFADDERADRDCGHGYFPSKVGAGNTPNPSFQMTLRDEAAHRL